MLYTGFDMLKRTRLSFIYVILYLSMTGLGFLLVPELMLRTFFSNGHYDGAFVRVSGAFLIVLSILIAQIVRYHLEVLYKTIILVRLFLLAFWAFLFTTTRDPLFLIFFAVVGLGVFLSVWAFILDRKV